MSELRRDPITGRWSIIDVQEPVGPDTLESEQPLLGPEHCPFCPGHESMTPPEIYAVRTENASSNAKNWQVRVVPNKFPALQIEGTLTRRGFGVLDQCEGIGAHEVIIETPDHHRQMADLSIQEIARVLAAYKLRAKDLRNDPRLKYSLIFKNVGTAAGATLEHAHSQLIALPIVPKRVQEELLGAERYFEFRERCVFCDMLDQEMHEDERIVCENRSFAAYCPFVSRFPFEMWILPKEHLVDFDQTGDETLHDLARLLKETLLRLRGALSNPPYNFMIHTAPVEAKSREYFHWHIELIPALTRIAGFEWGTGFYINPTPPEFAAEALRKVTLAL